MKLVFLVSVLAVLLNNSCSSGTEQNGGIKLEFSDLNGDIIYQIFSQLPLRDLVNIAQTNFKHSLIAVEVFRRMHRDVGLKFQNSIVLWTPFEMISNSRTIAYTLKHFGKYLKKLLIDYNHNGFTALDKLKVTFEQVEEITCTISKNFNETKSWNQQYPNLRRLKLNLFVKIDISFINCKLPHLEYLSLKFFDLDIYSGDTKLQIEEMIEKNPTIRGMEVYNFYPGFLMMLDQKLPNLENLTLSTLKTESENSIHLRNIKNLDLFIHYPPHAVIEKFSLPHLESLKMYYNSEYRNEWNTFFQKHTNVSRLHVTIPCNCLIYMQQFNEIMINLTNLVEISAGTIRYTGIHPITQFIGSHGKLNIFRFKLSQFTEDDLQALQMQFANEWDIKAEFNNNLSFRRKSYILEQPQQSLLRDTKRTELIDQN